jgi:hypothetical protein
VDSRLISETIAVVVASDVLASELGSEHVVLNLKNGMYYGLEDVGSAVWNMLQKPVSADDICRELAKSFDVDPARCRRDILSLLADLLAHGLIEIQEPAR